MPAPIRPIRSPPAWRRRRSARILPGPYDVPAYRCRTCSVATNKPPILPYRGVARTGVCFAHGGDARRGRARTRPRGLTRCGSKISCRPSRCRSTTSPSKHFDSGDYPEVPAPRRRGDRSSGGARAPAARRARRPASSASASPSSPSRRRTAPRVYAGWGIPMVPGHEQATARLTPDGGLELRVGTHRHGQGLETTLAQVAHEILGVAASIASASSTATPRCTPYSTGTWGSRCMVMAGGAVARACEELAKRVLAIGAKLLQAEPDEVRLARRRGASDRSGSVAVAEVARTWYLRPQDLPADVDPGGLEVTVGYKPGRDTGTFSYAAHAAVVAVDTETGDVEILDYVVVEDGGVLVNPMIVDGQVYRRHGAGHRHRALRGDAASTRRASRSPRRWPTTCCPGATEVPDVAHRAHGDAVALYRVRPEGHRRRRRHRAAGGHRQRRQRRAARRSASRSPRRRSRRAASSRRSRPRRQGRAA